MKIICRVLPSMSSVIHTSYPGGSLNATKPRCLLVTVDFPPAVTGGIQRYYYDLCRNSAGRISVIAPLSKGCRAFDAVQNFKVTRVRTPAGESALQRGILTVLMALYTMIWLPFGGYDGLIIGHWFMLPALGWVGKALRKKISVILHGGELSRFREGSRWKRMIVRLLSSCDFVIVNSSYTAGQFRNHGVSPERLLVLTPGVDPERYQPRTGPGNGKVATLLTVATLVERKGHDRVISVLPCLLKKHPGTRYLIIGDGPYRPNLSVLARQKGVESSVEFLGRLTDEETLEYLHTCDIFVMTSRKLDTRFGEEGFGIVYLEANACGKPVVGGDSGGVRDAIVDGVTGLLIDPENGEALLNALDQLISRPDLRNEFGQNGRRRVLSDFQWRDRVESLFARVKTK